MIRVNLLNQMFLVKSSILFWSPLLKAEQTSQKRSWRLLLLLPKRGPRAFSSFCSALRETEQQHLFDLLSQSPEKDGRETRADVSVYLSEHQHKVSVYTAAGFKTLRLLSAHRVFSLRKSQGERQGNGSWREQKGGERWAEQLLSHDSCRHRHISWKTLWKLMSG